MLKHREQHDIPCARHFPNTPVDHSSETYKVITRRLYEESNEIAFAHFGTDQGSDVGVVLVCGWGERFASASVVRSVRFPTLVVQDPHAPWFTGSEICSGLDEVEAEVARAFGRQRRIVFVGQSSGDYASLMLASRFDRSVAVAVSPQTFDDRSVKSQVFFPPNFAVRRTPAIQDVRASHEAALARGHRSDLFLIVPMSESDNPTSLLAWGDPIHWVRMLGLPNVTVQMMGQNNHALFKGNVGLFSDLFRKVSDLAVDCSLIDIKNAVKHTVDDGACDDYADKHDLTLTDIKIVRVGDRFIKLDKVQRRFALSER